MAYKPLPENLTANKPATSHTHAAQEQVKSSLDFSNRKVSLMHKEVSLQHSTL